MKLLPRAIVHLLLSLSLAPSALAAAKDEAQAARRYELGRAAFEAGRFAEAAREFEAAFEAMPHAVALVMAADAWERAGRLELAADAWAMVPASPGVTADQATQAKGRTDALERHLGTVIVTSSAPARVRLDSGSARQTPARLHGEAGTRTLLAVLGEREQSQIVQLESGAVLKLHLVAQVAQRATRPSIDSGGVRSARWWTMPRVLGASLLGAGVAGLAVGTGFGLAATRTKEKFDRMPSAALREQGLSEVRVTNVGLIAGGLLALGGVGCLVLAPSPETSTALPTLTGSATHNAFAIEIVGEF